MVSVINEIAFVTATRFGRRRMVMVTIDRLEFQKPVLTEAIFELLGEVTEVNEVQVKVQVVAYADQISIEKRDLVVSGVFTFKAAEQVTNKVIYTTPFESHDCVTFIGGETELREEVNKKLFPKTVARATLYNYLRDLDIRKALYTARDVRMVIDYIKTLRVTRRKSD